jgi:hypothetical protein
MPWAAERPWLFLYSGRPNDSLLKDLNDCCKVVLLFFSVAVSTLLRVMTSHCGRIFAITLIGRTTLDRVALDE